MSAFIIRRAQPRDHDAIMRITTSELGAGYFVRRNADVLSTDPAIDTFVATVGRPTDPVDPNPVIGYVSVITVDRERLNAEFKIPTELDGPHGLLKVAAVEAEYQHMGVGGLLGSAVFDALLKRGVKHLWSSAWINPETGAAAGSLLAHAGLLPQGIVKEFWLEESMEFPEWPCTADGVPCRCSAMIYTAPFDPHMLNRKTV